MTPQSRGYQVPEGLQALLAASQVLKQESSPVVQTPMGPRPTVAGQVSQGLEQLTQQAMPPMQGAAIPAIAQQAGIGAQIQAQQQAQQQQAAQDPQQIAQMAAQMVQARQPQRAPEEQGIGALPVSMDMAEGGIVGFAEGDLVPPARNAIERPTFEGVFGQVQSAFPDQTAAQHEQLQAIRAERAAKKSSQEDLYAAEIAAIQQASAAREEAMRRRAGNDAYNTFMAMLQDVSRPGAGALQQNEEAEIRRGETNAAARLAEIKGITALKKAKQADELGDIDRREKELQEFFAARDAHKKLMSQALSPALSMASSVYSTDKTAETARENERSRAADRAAMRDQGEQQKLSNAFSSTQSRLNDLLKQRGEVFEKHKMALAAGSDPEMAKNPILRAQYENAINVLRPIEEEIKIVQNRRNQLSALLEQAAGLPPAPVAAPSIPVQTATNPKTGERIKSVDGGKTWQKM